jgi:hypothetical protein
MLLGIKSNYSAIANLHILQITTAHARSLPILNVITRRFLVTASNNGYSSASGSSHLFTDSRPELTLN